MARSNAISSICFLVVLTSSGCQNVPIQTYGDSSTSNNLVSTTLPPVPADDRLPDPLQTAATHPPLDAPKVDPAPRNYRGLDLRDCLSLAARNSPLAAALDAKRSALACDTGRHQLGPDGSKARSNRLLGTALALQADEIRNQDAGKAGETFFNLVRAEAQEVIASRSQANLQAALGTVHIQSGRGLPVQEIENRLRREEVELRAKRAKLSESIDRLSLVLRETLGLAPADADWVVRPLIDWQAGTAIPEAEVAVAIGLANRPQLRLLRTTILGIEQGSLPVAGQVLSTIYPLLGPAASGISYVELTVAAIAAKVHKTEPLAVTQLREQTRGVLAWRERAIAAEIRDAVLAVKYQAQQVSVARDKYALRAAELKRLEEKAGHGLTPSLELATARLDLFEAESLWIDQLIELRVQEIRLQQAQGLLAGSAFTDDSSAPMAGH